MNYISPTEFFEACSNGDFETVVAFIEQNKHPIDCKNDKGWTGLIMASFNEHIEIAKLLIESGANVNESNHKGTTVFMYAKTPIQTNPSKTEYLGYLLEKGANINARDQNGLTALDYVEKNGFETLAKWLKDQGATNSNNTIL